MSEDDLNHTLSSIDGCLARLEDGTQQIDAQLVRLEGIVSSRALGYRPEHNPHGWLFGQLGN